MYLIDPDGPGGVKQFSVECDMTQSPVATRIHHNREERTFLDGHNSRGYVSVQVTYPGVTYTQIRKLVMSSKQCSYYFKFECHGIRFSEYTYWKGYDGEDVSDWAGTTDSMCHGPDGMSNV